MNDGFDERDFVNYTDDVVCVMKQHGMLAPGEEELLRGELYYA